MMHKSYITDLQIKYLSNKLLDLAYKISERHELYKIIYHFQEILKGRL